MKKQQQLCVTDLNMYLILLLLLMAGSLMRSQKKLILHSILLLTAIVPSSHGSDDKKYVATGRRITDAREEQKRSRCFVRTLLIKDFKYGSSLSLLTEKIMTINGRKVSQF